MKGFLKYIALVFLMVFVACCQKEECGSSEEAGGMIEVPLNIAVQTSGFAPDTKAVVPYIPDYENLIYDIWVLQYSNRGVLLSSTVAHYRADAEGVLKVTDETILLRESEDNCTVCLLVNMGPDPLMGTSWPDNLEGYMDMMVPVSMLDTPDGGKKMPMNGFYYGPIPPVDDDMADSDSSSGGYAGGLNVSLGRMMCRVNVVLNNSLTTEGFTRITRLDVRLQNIPTKAHVFPHTQYVRPDRSILGTVSESVDVDLLPGDSQNFYYYMAPNLYFYEPGGTDFRTSLYVNAAIENLGERSGTMILGNTRPDAPSRDYSLYPNNNYTFTINLTNLK